MTRLYDRLRPDLDDALDEVLERGRYTPVVFDISNVAHYHHAHQTTYDDLTKFPNVAPPFGCYWMEWRRRPTEDLPLDRLGVCIIGTDGAGEPLPDDARWSIGFVLMGEDRRHKRLQLGLWHLMIDADGQISVTTNDIYDDAVDLAMPPTRRADPRADPQFDAELAEAKASGDRKRLEAMLADAEKRMKRALTERHDAEHKLRDVTRRILQVDLRIEVLYPVLLAHSLMACKNVEQEEHTPPERLSRKHQRKKGHGLVKFYTLVINPMGGGGTHEGRVNLGDGMTALHIVRGHFKTYTAERPLFGKRVGTYWWSPMTRGKIEHGEIVKDYEMGTL